MLSKCVRKRWYSFLFLLLVIEKLFRISAFSLSMRTNEYFAWMSEELEQAAKAADSNVRLLWKHTCNSFGCESVNEAPADWWVKLMRWTQTFPEIFKTPLMDPCCRHRAPWCNMKADTVSSLELLVWRSAAFLQFGPRFRTAVLHWGLWKLKFHVLPHGCWNNRRTLWEVLTSVWLFIFNCFTTLIQYSC